MLPGFDLFYLVSPWTDSSAQVYAPPARPPPPSPRPSLTAHGQRSWKTLSTSPGQTIFPPARPEPASELCEPSGRLILSRTQRNRKGKTAFCGARRVAARSSDVIVRGNGSLSGGWPRPLPFSSVEGRSRGGSSEAQSTRGPPCRRRWKASPRFVRLPAVPRLTASRTFGPAAGVPVYPVTVLIATLAGRSFSEDAPRSSSAWLWRRVANEHCFKWIGGFQIANGCTRFYRVSRKWIRCCKKMIGKGKV